MAPVQEWRARDSPGHLAREGAVDRTQRLAHQRRDPGKGRRTGGIRRRRSIWRCSFGTDRGLRLPENPSRRFDSLMPCCSVRHRSPGHTGQLARAVSTQAELVHGLRGGTDRFGLPTRAGSKVLGDELHCLRRGLQMRTSPLADAIREKEDGLRKSKP